MPPAQGMSARAFASLTIHSLPRFISPLSLQLVCLLPGGKRTMPWQFLSVDAEFTQRSMALPGDWTRQHDRFGFGKHKNKELHGDVSRLQDSFE